MSHINQEDWSLETLLNTVGIDVEEKLYKMMLADYVLNNIDRHWGNFGFILDAETREVLDLAPLHDHGHSLWYSAMSMDFPIDANDYSQVLSPVKDIEKYLKDNLTSESRKHLINLARDINYILPYSIHPLITEEHLKEIREGVRTRIGRLLEW